MRSNIILSTYHIMSQAQANDIESARRAAAATLVGMKNPTMREAAEALFQFSRNPNVFPTTPPTQPSNRVQPQLPNANADRINRVPIQRAEPSPDFQRSPEGVVPSGEVTATSTVTGANVPNLPSL